VRLDVPSSIEQDDERESDSAEVVQCVAGELTARICMGHHKNRISLAAQLEFFRGQLLVAASRW
jgi:hypothetical protein